MPVRDVRYIHAFSSRSSISATRPRRGAPALVGDLCAHRRNDTPFIATRKSIERCSPPSHERAERDMERERERERREGRVPAGILSSQMVTTTTYSLTPSHPCVTRYVSRLPSASMVLSTLQKSLSTCCLSVSLVLYIHECRGLVICRRDFILRF